MKIDANDILREDGPDRLRHVFDRSVGQLGKMANGHGFDAETTLGSAPSKGSPLAWLRPISLAGKEAPERRWIVPNWVPAGVVTGLYGDGGLGKTLLAQQLLTSAALGRPWIGQYTERVKALGLFCEDSADELHRRQADINTLYNCSFADLADIVWLPRLGDDNMLIAFSKGRAELTAFHKQILEAAQDFGARVVVIDTVSDTFGGNEND